MKAVLRRRALLVLPVLLISAGCSRQAAPPAVPAPAPVSAPAPAPDPAPPPAPTPTPAEPDLPGTVMVMVDNQADARPQSGLDKADLIYEVEAEGGITRFLALFYHHKAEKIGPVRSARWYFIDIAKAYGGPYAHAGANADALDMLSRDHGVENVDEIYGSGGYFWRTRDRRPPHNLYTSTTLLLQAAADRRWKTPPLPDWPAGALPAGGTPLDDITLAFHKVYTVVRWHWDGQHYQRYQNGDPHLTADGAPLLADNLAVMMTDVRAVYHAPDWELEVQVKGEGEALFLSGGKLWKGRWHKDSPGDQYRFTVDGAPFPFQPGTTWVEVLPGPSVEYTAAAAG